MLLSALNPDEDKEWKTPNTRILLSSLSGNLSYKVGSDDICVAWIRQDNPKSNDEVKESLTVKSLRELESVRPGTQWNVFVSGEDLVFRPLFQTNSVTALVFGKNCKNMKAVTIQHSKLQEDKFTAS